MVGASSSARPDAEVVATSLASSTRRCVRDRPVTAVPSKKAANTRS
jgi:hypothetical protein